MKWVILLILAVVGLIVGLSFYLQPNDFVGCSQTPVTSGEKCLKSDAIVVVSGGDTQARTAEGVALYKNGWANALVLSGAARDTTGLSNAEVMRQQAIAAGVPDDAILIDEEARDTQENAENTQSILARHNYDEVILVTSGYHQRRAFLEFEKQSGDVTVLNHPLLNDKDWSFVFWWLTPRGWWLAGGETIKIIAFHITGAVQ